MVSSACEQDGCFYLFSKLKRGQLFHPRLSASRTRRCGRALRLRNVKWTKGMVTPTMRRLSSMARMRKVFPLSTNAVSTGVTLARMVSSSGGSDDGTQTIAIFHDLMSCLCLYFLAAFYGNGSYFAVNASYSAQDTYSKPNANGEKFMYVCRVLTGEFALGQQGLVEPPNKGLNSVTRYDSVVDNIQKPSIFVVFHDAHAYPEYLITFK